LPQTGEQYIGRTPTVRPIHEQVLHFWFAEITPAQWWRVDPGFDAAVVERFGSLHAAAHLGELSEWRNRSSTPPTRFCQRQRLRCSADQRLSLQSARFSREACSGTFAD
jgi:hypothetical protein